MLIVTESWLRSPRQHNRSQVRSHRYAAEHLIKSGLPTEAMVASVRVVKYGWHLPLYR